MVEAAPWIPCIVDGLRLEGFRDLDFLFALFRDVGVKSAKLHTDLIEHRAESAPIPIAAEKHQSLFSKGNVNGVSYGYRVEHLRPTYDYKSETDPKAKRVKNQRTTEKELILIGQCEKYFMQFCNMSHGCVIFRCDDHYQNMGYHVMTRPESVNDYFSVLMMMYPGDSAPDHFIMDNGCNFQKYCMFREPKKFRSMKCWTDEFHGGAGHKCGPLFSVTLSKNTSSVLSNLNDSSIEQMNRMIKLVKISAQYMKTRTFNETVELMLEVANRRQIRKTEGKIVY